MLAGAAVAQPPLPPPTGVTPVPVLTPPSVPAPPGRPVAFQKPADPKAGEAPKPPGPDKPPGEKERTDPGGALPATPGEAPSKELVFRLQGDDALNQRVLTELNPKNEKMKADSYKFPAGQPLVPAGTTYIPKTYTYPASQSTLSPLWVSHRRLYFEEMNSERAGWDAGLLQPVISTAYFYKDTLFWPHNLASGFWKDRYDVSAGKCMPGNPTPYYLYPPGFTAGGTLLEATLVTGTVFIFP